ncbi:MAG: dihydrolipoamide acetyltransferase family protein [Actinomycetota bacterium]|nr:dihydrolipoamide acetyltransferase family protein [Actinomycetota bacterium]
MAEVLMPRLSDTMEEGTVARWLKQPGDQVARGETIAEIDTDKATMDLEAFEEGVLEQVLVPEGGTVPIGAPVAVIGTGSGAPASARPSAASGAASPAPTDQGAAPVAASAAPAAQVAPPAAAGRPGPAGFPSDGAGARVPRPAATRPDGALRSSPLARRAARRHGVDLSALRGSGPGGRVVRADVERAVAAALPGPPAGAQQPRASGGAGALGDVEEVPLSQIRRVTAERLAKSLEAPHFYLTSVVDAERLLALRAEAVRAVEGGDGVRVTVTDLLVKACAKLLRSHPEVNSAWAGDKILRHHRVNIGIAVAVPEGLVVPVVKDADEKPLLEMSAEAHALAARAREGKLSLDDMSGGTFTLSNLGMFGIDHFTAVLNPPQAAILAVGAAKPEPVVRDGEIVVTTTMRLTLSIDHRALDGATAARFLSELRSMLEDPLRIVL